jgi:hypothetical protein
MLPPPLKVLARYNCHQRDMLTITPLIIVYRQEGHNLIENYMKTMDTTALGSQPRSFLHLKSSNLFQTGSFPASA